MYKGIFSILFSILFLSLLSCTTAKTDSQSQLTTQPHPQYMITVTHMGKTVGHIIIETWPELAPKHCANFDSLVSIGFYNGTAFHRVIPGFMIQGGDPNSKDKPRDTWGIGDPNQRTVPAEFSDITHDRGILSTARVEDINSATSQFFIMVKHTTSLDGRYTVFGKVLEGMEVADYIVNVKRDPNDNPFDKVEMTIERLIK